MLPEDKREFSRENIDIYLKEIAKEYRKLTGKSMPAELILIGGASILINYSFRNSTTDIDAIIHASSSIKDAISIVGNKYGLPFEWLNSDFIATPSYSPKLIQYSKYYKTFSNIVESRSVLILSTLCFNRYDFHIILKNELPRVIAVAISRGF